MRLQEVYSICKKASGTWCDLKWEEKKYPSGNNLHMLINAGEVRTLLLSLDKIESLKNCIDKIKASSIGFTVTDQPIIVDQRNKLFLNKVYESLAIKVTTIAELFESMNYACPIDGFDIKLPPNISLSDLSKCTKDLNIIFSTCPLLASQDATISFSAVDVGSVWLSFIIGGSAVAGLLSMIAILVDKAIAIRSHHLTTQAQAEQIKQLGLGNEILANYININEKIGKRLLENICDDLATEHEVNTPEDKERLKNSVQLLSDWMGRGMEIYACIQSPTEIKAVFPSLEIQALPLKANSMLSDGTNEKNE